MCCIAFAKYVNFNCWLQWEIVLITSLIPAQSNEFACIFIMAVTRFAAGFWFTCELISMRSGG